MLSAKVSDIELAPINQLKSLYGFPEPNTLTFREFITRAVADALASVTGQPAAAPPDPAELTALREQVNGLQYALTQADAENINLTERLASLQSTPAPAAPIETENVTVNFSKTDLHFIDAMKRPFEQRHNTEITRADYVHSMIKGLYTYGKIHSNVLFTAKEIRDQERANQPNEW